MLEVVVPADTRESKHTHARLSVMTVTEPARIRCFNGYKLVFESEGDLPPGPPPQWMEPDGRHPLESMDNHTAHASNDMRLTSSIEVC